MHGHDGSNHFLSKKSAGRKRRFAVANTLTGKTAKNIKKKLGV
jgi:ribosomal protein L35